VFTIFGDFLLALLITLSFLGFELRDLGERTNKQTDIIKISSAQHPLILFYSPALEKGA
jgi:hypothetical protein